jgi:osmotically-inducible protein OsmY
MISFSDQFGELESCAYKAGDPYRVRVYQGKVTLIGEPDPLAAMCNYRNRHSVERMTFVESKAKEYASGLMSVRELCDRSRIGA